MDGLDNCRRNVEVKSRVFDCKAANGIQIRINNGTFGTNYMSTNYKYIKNDT